MRLAIIAGFILFGPSQAAAVTLSANDGTADNGAALATALSPSNGVSLVSGSSSFTGASSQSALFGPSGAGAPIFGARSGIVLTTGNATVDNFAGASTLSGPSPLLETLYADDPLIAATGTVDQNQLSVDFTLGAGFNAVQLDIVFATDEGFFGFGVQDPFAVLVDGDNIATDGDTPIYRQTTSPGFFEAAGFNIAGTNYNLVSNVLTLTALLTPGTYTLDIAIADAQDTILDSALFVSNLRGTNIGTTPIPLPAPAFLLIGALGLMALYRRRPRS
ncbi:MAG: choice-of-anchor L domain-containing protein [Pseudomonadota bacterium]